MSGKRKTSLASKVRGAVEGDLITPSSDITIGPSDVSWTNDVDLHSVKVIHTESDKQIQCEHCYFSSSEHTYLGVLNIAGHSKNMYKCNNCNYIFQGLSNSIKAYLEEVKSFTGIDEVSFIESKGDGNLVTDGTQQDVQYQLEQINYNSNSSRTDMSNIMITLTNLEQLIRDQQQEIQEIKNDPLRGLKDIVNDFNLE